MTTTSPITDVDLAMVDYQMITTHPYSTVAPQIGSHLDQASRHVAKWRPKTPGTNSKLRDNIVGTLGDLDELRRIFAMLLPPMLKEAEKIADGDTSQVSSFKTHVQQLQTQVGYKYEAAKKQQPTIQSYQDTIDGDVSNIASDMALLEIKADQDAAVSQALSDLKPYHTELLQAAGSLSTVSNGWTLMVNDLGDIIDETKEMTDPEDAEGSLELIRESYKSLIESLDKFAVDE